MSKNKKMSVTFKNHPPATGLARVGNPYQEIDIKLNKVIIGLISPPARASIERVWTVRFQVIKPVPDDNPNCDWTWIAMKQKFETAELAKEYTKTIVEPLSKKYTFKGFENE